MLFCILLRSSGSAYMLIETSASWVEARDACQTAGGQLAEIQSAEQEAAVFEVMEVMSLRGSLFFHNALVASRCYNAMAS